jgi:hypothetical protein
MAMALAAPGARADDAPTPEELREKYEQATDAFEAGELERARRLYLEVWQHQPTYDVATNLTGVEFRLGHHVQAVIFARAALDRFPPSEDPQARVQLQSLLDRAEQQVGMATIQAQAGAAISLDGRALGTAPLEPVPVEPGVHRFVASDGKRTASEEVTVSKGASFTVELAFGPSGAAPPASGLPAGSAAASPGDAAGESDRARGSKARAVAIVVGSALTAASLGAHIGLRVRTLRLTDDADELLKQAQWSPGKGDCADLDFEVCDDLAVVLEQRDRAGRWGNVTLGTTIGLGAATMAAIVWPRPRKEQVGLEAQPWVATGSGGLILKGQFR